MDFLDKTCQKKYKTEKKPSPLTLRVSKIAWLPTKFQLKLAIWNF